MPYWRTVWFSCVDFYIWWNDVYLHLVCKICIVLLYRWCGWRLLFDLLCPVPGNGGHQHGRYNALLLSGRSLFQHLCWFLTQHGLLLWVCTQSGGLFHTLVHSCLVVALLQQGYPFTCWGHHQGSTMHVQKRADLMSVNGDCASTLHYLYRHFTLY